MGMIREDELRRLINLVEASQIDELEVSRWGTRVRITRRSGAEGKNGRQGESADLTIALPETRPAAPEPIREAAPAAESHLVEVKSPMVGTFYSSPAPGEPSFVNVNDRVAVGQVVCIIEAMKLMNEIHAEVGGRIVRSLVGNGQPVEYGQPLYLIDPAS